MRTDASVKIKYSIGKNLEKVTNGTFIEEDVKALLIDIREDLPKKNILRELADFVAHPIRDRGIFNTVLSARYLKMKLIEEQKNKLTPEIQNVLSTEKKLSDFLLSGVDIVKIEKFMFEILFQGGLDDLSNKFFKDNFPMKKSKVKELISNSYSLDTSKKFYLLKHISAVSYSELENVLKFIRGTVQFTAVFNQVALENELINAIRSAVLKFGLEKNHVLAFKRNIKEVILCIMCLLHDSKFLFYDSHVGSCFLSLYQQKVAFQNNTTNVDNLICLMAKDVGITYPIFISDIKLSSHLPKETWELNKVKCFDEIPWFNTERDEVGNLLLTKE